MKEVRFHCTACKLKFATVPTEEDVRLAQTKIPRQPYVPDAEIYFGWEMQKLRRADVVRWSELFTARNLAVAGELIHEINSIEDADTRRWLRITFTSALAQFTKMIADFSGRAGGPSWKLNCYWLPDKWQELNPLRYFKNRVVKTNSALKELSGFGYRWQSNMSVLLGDSRSLSLESESVDYIFTDPPYGGEGIQYGELSMLWGLWLGHEPRLESEIAFNPFRGFDQNHYASGLHAVFAECARVLKPAGWMTVAFANKDPEVWDALMSACRATGFRLVTAAPMARSAPALTETTMRRAPKADLLLTFRRDCDLSAAATEAVSPEETYPLAARVTAISEELRRSGVQLTPHAVYDRITIDWFSWFYENGERPPSLQPTLDVVEKLLHGSGAS